MNANAARGRGGAADEAVIGASSRPISAALSPSVNPRRDHCCRKSDPETIALLVQEDLRRVPSQDLVDEQQHLRREVVAVRVDGEGGADLELFYRKRLEVIDTEIFRRRRLEHYGAPKVPRGGRIDPAIIAEIKQRVDLVDLICEDLGHIAWVRGNRTRFHCRLHGTDSDPSLVVYEDGHWYCFGCHDGGDAIDWLIKARQLEWVDALLVLAAKCRIELPQRHQTERLIRVG